MILVDTSVWVGFLRGSREASRLADLLEEGEVCLHPWVRGELALGRLGPRRRAVLSDLQLLPALPVLPDDEIVEMIHARSLAGRGIGWVDVHLLASALLSDSSLWTFDRALFRAARDLEVGTG